MDEMSEEQRNVLINVLAFQGIKTLEVIHSGYVAKMTGTKSTKRNQGLTNVVQAAKELVMNTHEDRLVAMSYDIQPWGWFFPKD